MSEDIEYLFLCLVAVAVAVCKLLLWSFANTTKPEPAGTSLKKLAHQDLLRNVQSSIVLAKPGNVPSILQWKNGWISCVVCLQIGVYPVLEMKYDYIQ